MEPIVCCVCPTRSRLEDATCLAESFLATSTKAKIIYYVDEDENATYAPLIEWTHREPRISVYVGARVGPVVAANMMVHKHRGSLRIYGMVPDDSKFMTPGWDDYLIETIDSFPNRIGVVAAAHNGGGYVNFPWVSREWVEAAGWYYYSGNFHHCCDTIVELLGDATKLVFAPPERFTMLHYLKHCFNRDKLESDAVNFLMWAVGERRQTVDRLRAAMEAK